ncbi:type II CAAX prenyl endopeptidase Rce1 family protein [Corynebacterium qintianiae]|uniref:CPBP family glutamic-type intramembrane protease n=1 Tax=Corynebacterium qintianiae TaxID=2709392 RepID=UPI0013EDE5F6|nr:CPBP family glutamic-type intramembrane protease [Corynebacterium qintianiae]
MSRLKRTFRARRSHPGNVMTWWDLAILTAIFFGPSIVLSVQTALAATDAVEPTVPEFTTEANWGALWQQSMLLALAAGYILARRIKLVPWSIKPTVKGTALGAGLFALCGGLFDLAYTVYGAVAGFDDAAAEAAGTAAQSAGFDPSLLVYSVFNGFFEEFFFLVVCLSLRAKWATAAAAYSILVRISFHTYQGVFNALLIGAVYGTIFYALSRKMPAQRIYPFVLAHALADYFGTGLVDLLNPQA